MYVLQQIIVQPSTPSVAVQNWERIVYGLVVYVIIGFHCT